MPRKRIEAAGISWSLSHTCIISRLESGQFLSHVVKAQPAVRHECTYRYYRGTVCSNKFEPPVRSLCVQPTCACPTILCLAMVSRDTNHE